VLFRGGREWLPWLNEFGYGKMNQDIPYSHRFNRNIRLTHHVHERMAKRSISGDMLFDVIETGEIRHKSETELWIFKHYKERPDNLVCVAVLLAKAVIVKTVLVDWILEDKS
jgi:hypothetical protein